MTVDLDVPPGLVVEDDEWDGMLATAVLDESRTYRYLLTRIWDADAPPMVWVMFAPPTTDPLIDDKLLRRAMGHARARQAGGVIVVNLFALRCDTLNALARHEDPVGPYNDTFIRWAVAGAAYVVCAWGSDGTVRDRGRVVAARLAAVGARLWRFGVTEEGEPLHLRHAPRNAALAPYEAAEAAA